MKQDYKITIEYNAEKGTYRIIGYCKAGISNQFGQDGATIYEYSLNAVLEKIKEIKPNTFGSEAK